MKPLPENWELVPPPNNAYHSLAVYQQQCVEHKKQVWEYELARQSALDALRRVLSKEQFASYEIQKQFQFCTLSGRWYIIHRAASSNITVEGLGHICIVPNPPYSGKPVTVEGANFSQYMGLRYDEARTLREGHLPDYVR